MLNSLTKGAMMETSKRFPGFAKIVEFFFHKQIANLWEATAKNENYAIDLVEKSVIPF